jgi:hypothetical protein
LPRDSSSSISSFHKRPQDGNSSSIPPFSSHQSKGKEWRRVQDIKLTLVKHTFSSHARLSRERVARTPLHDDVPGGTRPSVLRDHRLEHACQCLNLDRQKVTASPWRAPACHHRERRPGRAAPRLAQLVAAAQDSRHSRRLSAAPRGCWQHQAPASRPPQQAQPLWKRGVNNRCKTPRAGTLRAAQCSLMLRTGTGAGWVRRLRGNPLDYPTSPRRARQHRVPTWAAAP